MISRTGRAVIGAAAAVLLAGIFSAAGAKSVATPALKSIPVAPVAADAKVAAGALKAPDQQAAPDLAFQSWKRNGAKIEAVAVNIGGAGAGVRTIATLSIFEPNKPVQKESVTVPALAPGATFALPFTLTQPGAFQIYLDSAQALAESNEDNNLTPITAPAKAAPRGASGGARAQAQSMRGRLQERYVSADGTTQPLAAAATPDGDILVFAENELTLRGSKAEAQAVAARLGGSVIDEIKAPAGWSWGSMFVIRLDPAAPAPGSLSAREQQTIFSSDRARNLLTIAKAENRKGAKLGVNLMMENNGLLEMNTKEAGGGNGLTLDYLQAGGPFDVDVATAWKMLAYAGKTKTKPIRLGMLDNGFGVGRSDWLERDLDVLGTLDASGANSGDCGEGNPCPWHGVNASEAAAGIADDVRGTTGPAAPVARLLLFDRGGKSMSASMARLWKLNESLPHIINMSFGGRVSRDESFFEGAWINALEDFEAQTMEIADKGDRLLIASAGNDGFDIDQVNGDGEELHWQYPCENQGVICVGGWRDFSDGPDFDGKPLGIEGNVWGKMRDGSSNYSSAPRGETVDIWGPWCTRVGDDFNNRGADATKFYCGTSAAAPVVSGVAALVWAANPKLSSKSVWQIMDKHAVKAGFIRRVHAREAVREALMTTGEKFKPDVEITTPVEGKSFSAFGDIALGYKAFDVEDGNKCCKAEWFIDNIKIGETPANSTAMKADISKLALGAHVARVKITDSDGFWDEATASFAIKNAPPTLKVVEVGNSAVKKFTDAPNFYDVVISDDALPFGAGPDECKKVVWTDSLGAMTAKPKSGCRIELRFLSPGGRTVTVSWTDKFGEKSTTAFNVQIDKLVGFKARIVQPSGGELFAPGDIVNIEVEALNAKGPLSYVWQLVSVDASGPTMKPFTPTSLGSNKFSFRPKDLFPSIELSSAGGQLELRMEAESAGAFSYDSVKFSTQPYIK